MSDETINNKLDELLDRMAPLPDRMWTKSDCMKYLGNVSEAQFRRISANPDFPAPAKFPVGSDAYSHPRYFASEVIEFSRRPEYRQISQAS